MRLVASLGVKDLTAADRKTVRRLSTHNEADPAVQHGVGEAIVSPLLGNVAWLGAPPLPGTSVQIHHWAGQPRVLSTDGSPLGTVQAPLNPGRAGLLRAQVAQDVGRINITYLGPADLSGG
jgi:hypothetical protein